jgi:hypothetical protein
MGHTSWDCTVRPDQKAEKRIELMGNSRKELAGLPDRQPRRVKYWLQLSIDLRRDHRHRRHQCVAPGGALR